MHLLDLIEKGHLCQKVIPIYCLDGAALLGNLAPGCGDPFIEENRVCVGMCVSGWVIAQKYYKFMPFVGRFASPFMSNEITMRLFLSFNESIYSQTCIERPPEVRPKYGLLRQVVS